MIEVDFSKHRALRAICLATTQAFLTVRAAVVLIAPANAIASLHVFAIWASRFDDANAFVSEDHVR